jgi:hypothetical protein
MLDVHPPHTPTHTWKDFFLHIATITVGLLIAVGLEQTVEAIHHHHQREYLEQQMHVESVNNLALVKPQLAFEQQMVAYLNGCIQALNQASRHGDSLVVTLPVNHVQLPLDANGMLISPSRGTWTVAKAAGTISLLPPETAKVYARLDLAEEFEQQAERDADHDINYLTSARLRNHAPETADGTPLQLTAAQRDDLLFAFTQFREDCADFGFRLAIVQGGLEAILDDVHSLEGMYPYQGRAIRQTAAPPPLPPASSSK